MFAARDLMIDANYWATIPEVLRPADVARITRKKIETVWSWLPAAHIPGHKIGYIWIIYRESLQSFLETPDAPFVMPEEFLARFPEQLTVDQASELVGMGKKTAYAWLLSGELPARKVGRTWLIYKSEVVDMLRRTANFPSVNS